MGRFFVAYPGQRGVTWLTETGKDVVNPRSVRVNRVKYNGGVWWTLHLYSEREGTWLTSRSKSKIHWDNRRTLPPLPLTQWRKQRHPCVMPLSQASLAASLMCVFVVCRICASDWWIAAAAGSICFLGELSAEEETRLEAHRRPQAWSAGWGCAHTANRDSW